MKKNIILYLTILTALIFCSCAKEENQTPPDGYKLLSDKPFDEMNAQERLIFSVKTGNNILLDESVAQGADVNGTNENGLPLLISAVLYTQLTHREIIVEQLLDHGADPNVVYQGKSSILYAVEIGNDYTAEVLLHHGASADTPGNETPLTLAIKEEKMIMVEMLMAHGASMDLLNDQGESPMVLAEQIGLDLEELSHLPQHI